MINIGDIDNSVETRGKLEKLYTLLDLVRNNHAIAAYMDIEVDNPSFDEYAAENQDITLGLKYGSEELEKYSIDWTIVKRESIQSLQSIQSWQLNHYLLKLVNIMYHVSDI